MVMNGLQVPLTRVKRIRLLSFLAYRNILQTYEGMGAFVYLKASSWEKNIFRRADTAL